MFYNNLFSIFALQILNPEILYYDNSYQHWLFLIFSCKKESVLLVIKDIAIQLREFSWNGCLLLP